MDIAKELSKVWYSFRTFFLTRKRIIVLENLRVIYCKTRADLAIQRGMPIQISKTQEA